MKWGEQSSARSPRLTSLSLSWSCCAGIKQTRQARSQLSAKKIMKEQVSRAKPSHPDQPSGEFNFAQVPRQQCLSVAAPSAPAAPTRQPQLLALGQCVPWWALGALVLRPPAFLQYVKMLRVCRKSNPDANRTACTNFGSFHFNPFPSFCFQKHFWCQCHRQVWKNSPRSRTAPATKHTQKQQE